MSQFLSSAYDQTSVLVDDHHARSAKQFKHQFWPKPDCGTLQISWSVMNVRCAEDLEVIFTNRYKIMAAEVISSNRFVVC